MNKSKKKDICDIIQIRDDLYINRNNIDTIIRTNINPKTQVEENFYFYVIFLKDSKYEWITMSEKDFNNFKQYILKIN